MGSLRRPLTVTLIRHGQRLAVTLYFGTNPVKANRRIRRFNELGRSNVNVAGQLVSCLEEDIFV